MPGQLYSAAGEGYFESYGYGQSRKTSVVGLDDYDYVFGLAVDSANPNTVIISASRWPYQAHSLEGAESLIYRRTSPVEEWKLVSNGLPKPTGTMISILAANPKTAGEFYAVNNRGIFCSTDLGISWKMLDGIQWSKEYLS